jgi:hypothetical protein
MAGVLVTAFGVPWSITALGLFVATTALVVQRANERDEGRRRATPRDYETPPAARSA